MFHYENKLNETPIIFPLNLLDHIWNITSDFISKIRHDSLGMKSLKLNSRVHFDKYWNLFQ